MPVSLTDGTEDLTLHEALKRFQEAMPSVGKDNEADTGKYKYKYADLTTVTEIALPLLLAQGLVWHTAPTTLDGQAVLHYELSNAKGESIKGDYPLGSATQAPQALGSAITYARRYALCAVTGIAPADDDGKQASTPPDMTELHQPPKGWQARVDGTKTLAELQALYDTDAHKWFTEEVKLAFTAQKIILGG